jgi:hypothetical protein
MDYIVLVLSPALKMLFLTACLVLAWLEISGIVYLSGRLGESKKDIELSLSPFTT